MKKNAIKSASHNNAGYSLKQFLLVMKLTTLLLIIVLVQVSASGFGQKINLKIKNTPIKEVIQTIEKQSGYTFFYDTKDLPEASVTVSLKDASIDEALKEIFKDVPMTTYMIVKKNVILTKTEPIKLRKVKPEENNVNEVAPPINITGSVMDAKTGESIVGVTVRIEGTSNGVITDVKGKFTLKIPKPDVVLVFSCVGYDVQRIVLKGQLVLDIKLIPSLAKLDEVVVVGYGNQKKQSVVSAISTVKGDELSWPGRNLTNNLAGQVSGLISVQRSTEPGYDGAEFWIRGISTYAGGSSPLILVDGVPRKISDIEPDEIETFSILKDAAATAVYGAEGANGVVIITSKRGQARKPVISFRTEHTINTPTRLPKFVGSADFLELYNEGLYNDGQTPIYSESLIEKYRSNVDPELYPNTDWLNVMLKKQTLSHRYTLNVRGGSDRARYFVSGAYYGEEGYFKDNPNDLYKNNIGLKRFNLRSNIDLDITSTTKVSVDLSMQYLMTQYPGIATSTIFRQMLLTPSWVFPPMYNDGTISTYQKERDSQMRNPYNMLMNSGYSKEWRSGIQSAVRLDQKLNFITEGLIYKATVSYDYDGFFSSSRSYNPSRYFATGRDGLGNLIFSKTYSGSPDLSSPTVGNNAQKKIYIENSLNYNRSFGDHTVGSMILYMQKEQQNNDNPLAYRKQGLVGRVTYSYANRYFFEGNFGYTGSETFAKGYRFGFFPAVGMGYLISNESFYPESIKKVISTFKLRASLGRTGNDATGGARFLYRPQFNLGASGFNQGITSGGGVNGYGSGITELLFEAPYLSWEIEDKKDLGINLGFLHDKIQFVGDYFCSERSKILLQRKIVPAESGFQSSPWENYGAVKVWGFDGSLDGSYPVTKDLTIGVKSTFTFSRNKVTEYDELAPAYPWMAVTGTRIGENTVYIAERLYTADDFIATQNTNSTYSYTLKPGLPVPTLGGILGPGDIKYKDLNGDGKIDNFDMKRGVGNPYIPEIVYGFGLNVQYKGFYASFFFQGTGNSSVILGGNTPEGWYPFHWGSDESNYRTFALDRWDPTKGADQNPLMPRIHMGGVQNYNNTKPSTWWMRNGNFLRLKNVEVGYNIPNSFLGKYKIVSARVYLRGDNLALWDHIKYWDPETGNADAGNSYPNSRSFTFGVEISL